LIAIAFAESRLIAPADVAEDDGDASAEAEVDVEGEVGVEVDVEAEGDGEAASSLDCDGDGVTTVPSGSISTVGGADGSSVPAASAVPPRASAATAPIARAEAVRSLIMRTSGVCCAEHHQVRVRRAMAALCDR
jgi:hypothetical protein